jgi:8-oxo-dGTP diphosphatase
MEKTDLTPKAACLRELYEETGIKAHEIEGVHLRYIVFHKTAESLHVYYDFAAVLKEKKELITTDEGTLHWISKDKLLTLPMHFTMRFATEHFLAHPMSLKTYAGIVRTGHDAKSVEWLPL